MGKNIVNIKLMGDALRNTGYKDIDSAVAEIVDNSIEAQAKDIFIILTEKIDEKINRKVVSEFAFLDNGIGMDTTVLGDCLGIGDTTKSNRAGMGRFGVGLPQASLFASPVVEVYSWQNGIENCQMVSLDINKVKSGEQKEIEDPISVDFPERYEKFLTYREEHQKFNFCKSGTLVLWNNYDKPTPKKATTILSKLEFSLGQKFRYFITQKTCKIKLICYNNFSMNRDVWANDPLMLLEENYVLGNVEEPKKAYYPRDQKNKTNLVPIFEPYGEVDIKVKYYDKNNDLQHGVVKAKFSIVKPEFYDQKAIKEGRTPGSYDIGKHVKKLEGISIMRANREIDFRKFNFYDSTNQPQHRWW